MDNDADKQQPPAPDLPPPPPPPPAPPASASPPPVDPYVPPAVSAVAPEEIESPGSSAPFGTRVIAAIIDAFVAAGIYFVLSKFSSSLAWLGSSAYWVVRDALPFLEGHSVGKRLMKIKAVTSAGVSLSGDWKTSAIRNISLVVPFFGIVELIVLFIRKNEGGVLRRLGDDWANTQVVVVNEPSAL